MTNTEHTQVTEADAALASLQAKMRAFTDSLSPAELAILQAAWEARVGAGADAQGYIIGSVFEQQRGPAVRGGAPAVGAAGGWNPFGWFFGGGNLIGKVK